MRTIAIVLGDNDFGTTFRHLLDGLKRVLEYHSHSLNRADIELIIRRSIMAYYIGYQYRFDLDGGQDMGGPDMEKYLNGIRVLFDEEAEADIATKDHDSGAWYLELQSGTVASY